jgi:hypothetical protein
MHLDRGADDSLGDPVDLVLGNHSRHPFQVFGLFSPAAPTLCQFLSGHNRFQFLRLSSFSVPSVLSVV